MHMHRAVTIVRLITRAHVVIIDALDILCAQLTRDLFAIAKFLSYILYLTL